MPQLENDIMIILCPSLSMRQVCMKETLEKPKGKPENMSKKFLWKRILIYWKLPSSSLCDIYFMSIVT